MGEELTITEFLPVSSQEHTVTNPVQKRGGVVWVLLADARRGLRNNGIRLAHAGVAIEVHVPINIVGSSEVAIC